MRIGPYELFIPWDKHYTTRLEGDRLEAALNRVRRLDNVFDAKIAKGRITVTFRQLPLLSEIEKVDILLES